MSSHPIHEQAKSEAAKLWSSELLEQVEKIVFPRPTDASLDGSDIGRVFFLDPDAHLQWDTTPIKTALQTLVDSVLKGMHMNDLIAAAVPPDITEWEHLMGAMLLLDQGPRYLCKGRDARYIYQFFDVLSLGLIQHLLVVHPEWFTLTGWSSTGLSTEQVTLRIMMLIAPFVHSEGRHDQRIQIELVEKLRMDFECRTGTCDPYRSTFESDLKDINLINTLLTTGPPQGSEMQVHDFVYWMMRYYTSHLPYVLFFGRSPFRNVAVGRDDTASETTWLHKNGVDWDDEDERIRRQIRADIQAGIWTPLQL